MSSQTHNGNHGSLSPVTTPQSRLRTAVLCAAAVLPGFAHAQAPTTASPANHGVAPAKTVKTLTVRPLAYSVSVNGEAAGDALILQLADGRLAVPESDFVRWHLVHPSKPTFFFKGMVYHALNDVPGFAAVVDSAKQKVDLRFAAAAFEPNWVQVSSSRYVPAQKPNALGGFLNYDVVADQQ